jgi:hypothetical protein
VLRDATLSACLGSTLLLVACGGGGGGGNSGTLAAAAKPSHPASVEGQRSAAGPKGSKSASVRATVGKTAPKRVASSAASATAGSSSAVNRGSTATRTVTQNHRAGGGGGTAAAGGGGRARHAGRKHHSGAGKRAKHPPKAAAGNPTAGIPGLPPPDQVGALGQSSYADAKSLCSDPVLVGLVPKAMQSDPEALASLYASYMVPQDRPDAYAGCLAGLHQLGL